MPYVDSLNGMYNSGNLLGSTGNVPNMNNSNLFSTILSGMMSQSTSSIGDFSSLSGSSAGNDMGLMGMGSGGSGAQGADNTLLLLLLVALMGQNGDNSGMMQNLMGNSGATGGAMTSNVNCQHVFTNAYQSVGKQGIPSDSWKASNPLATNHVGERNPNVYRNVINQFDVENNERYRVNKNGQNDTYCNIFAWDVTRAMGTEIPHYVNSATGEPVQYPNVGDATPMNANSMNDWLNTYGGRYGWRKVTPAEAQQYANAGMPAVTSWKNPAGHGHMQVVSPSADGVYDASRGVAIAQAGRNLYNYNYASAVYSQSRLQTLDYFVHI